MEEKQQPQTRSPQQLDSIVIEEGGWWYVVCEGAKLQSPYRTKEQAEAAITRLNLLCENMYGNRQIIC